MKKSNAVTKKITILKCIVKSVRAGRANNPHSMRSRYQTDVSSYKTYKTIADCITAVTRVKVRLHSTFDAQQAHGDWPPHCRVVDLPRPV